MFFMWLRTLYITNPVVKRIIQRYSPDFLQELITILTYHVGPVATIIITDILSDINQKIEFNNQVKKLLLRT